MAIVVLLLMTVGMPLQESSPRSTSDASDSTRTAVTKAALEHAISEAMEDTGVDPERMFVNLGGPPESIDPTEWADPATLVAVAEEHGLEIRDTDLRQHPARLACQERQSAACRAARGVTALTVGRVEVLEPERANAWISIRVFAPISRDSHYIDSVRLQQLHVEKVGGAWKVVGAGMTIVS